MSEPTITDAMVANAAETIACYFDADSVDIEHLALAVLTAALAVAPLPAGDSLEQGDLLISGTNYMALADAIEQYGWARQNLGRWFERDPADWRAKRQETTVQTEFSNLMAAIRAAMTAADGREE